MTESTSSGGTSRRRFLAAAGTAGAIGVAGCSGGSDGGPENGTGGNDSDSDGETEDADGGGSAALRDPTFTNVCDTKPQTGQFNRYNVANNAAGNGNDPGAQMFDLLFLFNSKTGEWHPNAARSIAFDGDSVTIEMDTDRTWSDGDAVTAHDLVTQLKLDRYARKDPVWELLDSVRAADEETVEIALDKAYNSEIVRKQLNRMLVVKESVYGKWLERIEDADGEDERNEVVSELTNTTISDPVTNGPYTLASAQQTFRLERFEEYPAETNIPNYEYLPISSTNQRWQAFIGDKLDGEYILVSERSILEQFPDHVERVKVPGSGFGITLFMQYDHPILGERKFRQAIASLIDRKKLTKNINPRNVSVTTTSGLYTDDIASKWLDDPETYRTYGGSGADEEQAASLLREMGLKKENDAWVDESGDPISFTIKTYPWPEPVGSGQTLASNFSLFGLDATTTSKNAQSLTTEVANGNFDMYVAWGGGGPHPYFSYKQLQGTLSNSSNVPLEATVPPVGDPEGETSVMDSGKVLKELALTESVEEAKPIASELAWYYNRIVPAVPLTSEYTPAFISTDDWEVPPVDDPRMYLDNPVTGLLRQSDDEGKALLRGKEK
jgi:peptide/nickel transport system substrate-binding protein